MSMYLLSYCLKIELFLRLQLAKRNKIRYDMQNKAILNKTQHRTVIYTKEEDLIPSLFFTKEPSIII